MRRNLFQRYKFFKKKNKFNDNEKVDKNSL